MQMTQPSKDLHSQLVNYTAILEQMVDTAEKESQSREHSERRCTTVEEAKEQLEQDRVRAHVYFYNRSSSASSQ